MSASWLRHLDITDANLYRVIARQMAADGRWLEPRTLPEAGARFYEHLPFGFWPLAAGLRLFGEPALTWFPAACSLATLALTGLLARRLAGHAAGLAAMGVLASTQNFFFLAPLPMLDPILIFLATASALPVLLGAPGARGWALAGALAALATLVKGPFGPLPFAAAVAARSLVERSPRLFLTGAGVGLAAALPAALFVALQEDWRASYGVGQLLDSALGVRTDGSLSWWFAWKTIAGRFWPGLPLLVPAAMLAVGRPRRAVRWLLPQADAPAPRAAALLGLTGLFVGLGLSLPARKVEHHVHLAFPLLAALAGVAAGPRLAAALRSPNGPRRLLQSLAAGLALAVALVAAGLGRWEASPPCVLWVEFAPHLASTRPGDEVLVVSPHDEWGMLAALAAERRMLPRPLRRLGGEQVPGAHTALVREGAWERAAGWVEVERARGWVLARR